ncbi:hypothetical protein HDU96_011070 [Phlyctochytrium bullatum]|nr:hypothetical protein HDU96_011070 [Phlyctochytrium bullatum]
MPGTLRVDTPDRFWWGANLTAAVRAGRVPSSRVDDMAVRVLSAWYKLGQDRGFPATSFNAFNQQDGAKVDVQGDHGQHIREVGAASSVLVKNMGETLPIVKKKYPRGIAVIGSDGFGPKTPLNFVGDHAEVPTGVLAQGWGSGTALFPYLVAPIDGMDGPAAAAGISMIGLNENHDIELIQSTASMTDLAVVFVNSNSGEEYLTVDGNKGDRNSLALWNNGANIITAAASAQRTVVVIHSPGPVDMPWLDHPNVTAVIYALFPGQEAGNAIADVLFGRVNPSGRLPFSVMRKREEYVADVSYDMENVTYSEGPNLDYRWYDRHGIIPVFPFGHGLSYTSFAYSNLTVHGNAPVITVTATITNTGDVAGHEVPQLYLQFPDGLDQPPKQLRGFDRVRISPGESAIVSFPLTRDDLSVWDVGTHRLKMPSGVFKVFVGASSRDLRLEGSFAVSASEYEP